MRSAEGLSAQRESRLLPSLTDIGGFAATRGCTPCAAYAAIPAHPQKQYILIGHLNKAAGGQSAYRGLGSIDFRAAARSVLLIGRVKREPNVRVIVHDKSSLAAEGKPIAFCLDPETGFSWIGEYDITADELLSGAGATPPPRPNRRNG